MRPRPRPRRVADAQRRAQLQAQRKSHSSPVPPPGSDVIEYRDGHREQNKCVQAMEDDAHEMIGPRLKAANGVLDLETQPGEGLENTQ